MDVEGETHEAQAKAAAEDKDEDDGEVAGEGGPNGTPASGWYLLSTCAKQRTKYVCFIMIIRITANAEHILSRNPFQITLRRL